MMNNIYSRPMFQNPQQRAGGGIMAGVAPINMADGGDLSVLDWAFGGGNNPYGDEGYVGEPFLEDLQENVLPLISFDPNDPIDQATIALLAVPGVNILARLTAMGLKGARLTRQLKKVEAISGKLIKPAGYGTGATLIAGAASDPEIQETVSSIGGTLGELGDLAPIYAEQKYDEYFGTPSLSAEGTRTLGQRTNNPFNVRASSSNDWQGADDSLSEGGYQGFSDSDDGIRAADRILNNYGGKQFKEGSENFDLYGDRVNTLREAISMYAPSSENPTENYIDFISDKTGIDPDQSIDLTDSGIRALIMSPMATFESNSTYSPEEISDAISRANTSGFDSLTGYANNMGEDIGQYFRKVVGKANGGIMRLQDGSGPNGVEEKVIPPEIEGVLDKYNLSLEEFLKFPDEKKQAYIKTYEDSLGIKKALVDAGPLSWIKKDGKSLVPSVASGIAGVLDVINMVPEGVESLYDAAKYSDFGRAVGFSDPDQERPDDDPSFTEDIERIRNARAPSLSEVNALIPAPVEAEVLEEKPEQIVEAEEKPGFIASAYGALKDYYGMGGTSENEKNAQRVANNTRREYGTSWQEVYNEALAGLELKDAKIQQANAAAAASGTNQVDEFVQAIKRYRPGITDSEALDLFLSTKSKTTGQFNNKDYIALKEKFYTTLIENKVHYTNEYDTDKIAGLVATDTTYDEWAAYKAEKSAKSLVLSSSPDLATAPSDEFTVTTRG